MEWRETWKSEPASWWRTVSVAVAVVIVMVAVVVSMCSVVRVARATAIWWARASMDAASPVAERTAIPSMSVVVRGASVARMIARIVTVQIVSSRVNPWWRIVDRTVWCASA